MAKSLILTYLLWMFGGAFGLHHFYLRRYRQALVWCFLPGGYFGFGWFRDLWRIPEYVRDANEDPKYMEDLTAKMRNSPKPPFSIVRCFGQLSLGNTLRVLIAIGIPNKEDLGIDLTWISIVLGPLAVALGVWLVGNIGRQQGSFKPVLLTTCLVSILEYYGYISSTITCIAGIIIFNWKCKQWRRTVRKPMNFWKVVFVFFLCGGLYTSLWVSYVYFNMRIITKDGDDIPIRDAIGNFLKSPAFQEFSENAKNLWSHAWEHGFGSTFQQLIESLDPLGEKNALRVLNLTVPVTKEEIRQRYRDLTKVWHPDKVLDPEKKLEAQERFMEIQQAYERLSDIKSKRARRNSKTED